MEGIIRSILKGNGHLSMISRKEDRRVSCCGGVSDDGGKRRMLVEGQRLTQASNHRDTVKESRAKAGA